MFKVARYYILLNLYQKVKRNIIAVMLSVFLLIVTIYLFGDLIDMAEENNKYYFVYTKWIFLFFLLSLIAINIIKILNTIRIPFSNDQKETDVDVRKEKIIAKEHLLSRSDLILDRYRTGK